MVATTAAALPASASVADRVTAQLQRDYPPGALDWVTGLSWQGPQRVPLDQIDRKAGDWSAADDKRKVERFAKRIGAGWAKPVILIRRPRMRLLYAVDGHTRISACAQLGKPVTAYVGTASTATGDWLKTHHRQLASDVAALELAVSPGGRPMDTSPFSASTTDNWVARAGGLPEYVRGVAHALLRTGRAGNLAQAVQMAVSAMKHWAAGVGANGRGHVHPQVQAAAAAALADWEAKRAAAHSHASDAPALELAGVFSEQLHPRVAKGHAGGGRFGSGGAPTSATASATASPAAPNRPVPPANAAQLHHQATQDRHLARQITVKVAGLIRMRDGYRAGILTATGVPKGKVTKAVSAARSAAAKKAAATRKRNGTVVKHGAAAATRAANVARINGQIRTLRHDAKALLKSANHLDSVASGL